MNPEDRPISLTIPKEEWGEDKVSHGSDVWGKRLEESDEGNGVRRVMMEVKKWEWGEGSEESWKRHTQQKAPTLPRTHLCR